MVGQINGIFWLTLSKENYQIAVDILKDRFGNTQRIIDLHYHKLINLPQAVNKTCSLRGLLDNIVRHIRNLEVLKQNIKQDVFVSMICSKLPEYVLLQLEILNGETRKWTVKKEIQEIRKFSLCSEENKLVSAWGIVLM